MSTQPPSEPHDTTDNTIGHTVMSLLGLGKKKKDEPELASPSSKTNGDSAPQIPGLSSVPLMNAPHSPPSHDSVTVPARAQSPHSLRIPNSPPLSPRTPPRQPSTRTTSPTLSPHRLSSPSSQIFERNVQEHPHDTHAAATAAIPGHIPQEDRIPAVLEASLLAITDNGCNVDDVEIVTSAGSQQTVGDRRRLSFISFADVVQAEQEDDYEGASVDGSIAETMGQALRKTTSAELRQPGAGSFGKSL